MPEDALEQVGNWLMAVAALGTAAFGVIEALKGTFIGVIGIGRVEKELGAAGINALEAVYGKGAKALMRNIFRRGGSDLATFLKNGLRLALAANRSAPVAKEGELATAPSDNVVRALATYLGQDPTRLSSALLKLQSPPASVAGQADEDVLVAERAVLGRIELAIDARVDGAVAAAQDTFAGAMRLLASCFAIAAGVATGVVLGVTDAGGDIWSWPVARGAAYGALIGVIAVPVAPIAKDLVSLLGSARDALTRWQGRSS